MEKIKESRSANKLAFIKHVATTCGCLRVFSLNTNLPPPPFYGRGWYPKSLGGPVPPILRRSHQESGQIPNLPGPTTLPLATVYRISNL